MKFIFGSLLLLTFFSPQLKAQQNFFVYIQTDNHKPFYVKMNNTVYSSTVSGYVILSKLIDTSYNLTVGFPKSEWPEQNFTVTVNDDLGYLLKNFGDKGWGLFDLQTFAITMTGTRKNDIVADTESNAFASMLSDAVNDPSIKIKPLAERIKTQMNRRFLSIL
ncbi:MAG: hypothetical protein WDM71_09225 [Ferruginibacter sp.]